MVHALLEARRVLVAGGVLIDLRPVAFNSPLEVLIGERVEVVDTLNGCAAAADDAACEAALATVTGAGAFRCERNHEFWSGDYWRSVEEFRARLNNGFRRFETPRDEVLLKLEEAVRRAGPEARIRIRDRMIIVRYTKTSDNA